MVHDKRLLSASNNCDTAQIRLEMLARFNRDDNHLHQMRYREMKRWLGSDRKSRRGAIRIGRA
jgi:hypothetical protein